MRSDTLALRCNTQASERYGQSISIAERQRASVLWERNFRDQGFAPEDIRTHLAGGCQIL